MDNQREEAGFLKGLFSSRQLKAESTRTNEKVIDLRNMPKVSTAVPDANKIRNKLAAFTNILSKEALEVLRESRTELSKSFNANTAQEGQDKIAEAAIASSVDKVLSSKSITLTDIERAEIIVHLQKDLVGWGILQSLIEDRSVTDIHVYDYRTVVCQKGKYSEKTDLQWPSHQAYTSFIDRLLLRLGKSLSTQQHTVDAAFADGTRICVIDRSVCVTRGPLLSIRIPRMMRASIDSLISLEVAPKLIVDYLGSLTRSGQVTMLIAGETGTGKTTVLKCLGSEFAEHESIVTVEDTPELNFTHPFLRALVSRVPNSEGIGEVTLQEHIKTTLRMTPTRVILGEMRTPLAAEAFLESAQTGHSGFSTLHARNARETLTRLESLLGRAQKSVSIDIIRQQIALAVDVVVWMFRERKTGKPRIGEIIEVGHFVEGAIQVKPMFRFFEHNEKAAWRVESWSSFFDVMLNNDGVRLSSAPQIIECNTEQEEVLDHAIAGNAAAS